MLITGASGLFGVPIVRELHGRVNYDICVVTTGRGDVEFPEGVSVVTANLLVRDQAIRLIEEIQPEIMLHMAWKVPELGFLTSKSNLVWLEDSLFILRKFIDSGGKYFAFGGSNAEYGHFSGHSENDTAENISLYGQCKNSFHKTATSLCSSHGIDYVNLRFFNILVRGTMKHISDAAAAFSAGKKFTCTHHPYSIFDYISPDDAAKAVCEVILRQYTGVVNIGSGIPRMMGDVFKTVAKKMNSEHLLSFDYGTQRSEIQVADTNILNNTIGFHCTSSFDDMIDAIVLAASR